MKFRAFILTSILIALSACDSSSGSGSGARDRTKSQLDCEPALDKSLIQGCWETSCEQSGSTYFTSVYSFDKDGYFYSETRDYEDSDCSDILGISPRFGETPSDISYITGDRYIDSSGVEVDQIRMIQVVEENSAMDFDFITIYKVLDEDQLCTTDSLRLETQRYSIGPGFEDIDYNKCIKRVE